MIESRRVLVKSSRIVSSSGKLVLSVSLECDEHFELPTKFRPSARPTLWTRAPAEFVLSPEIFVSSFFLCFRQNFLQFNSIQFAASEIKRAVTRRILWAFEFEWWVMRLMSEWRTDGFGHSITWKRNKKQKSFWDDDKCTLFAPPNK